MKMNDIETELVLDRCTELCRHVVDTLVLRTDAPLPFGEYEREELGYECPEDFALEAARDACSVIVIAAVNDGAPYPHHDPTTLLFAWEDTIESMTQVRA